MYATNAKANAALTTGIIGTAGVGVNLISNLLNALSGNNHANAVAVSSDNMCVNRYELNLARELDAEKAKTALLESNIYTDSKILDVYAKLESKINANRDAIAQQAVYNATVNSTIGCIQGQIAQLYNLTKLVVPNTSICPGWGNVTITPATAPTTTTAG